PEPDRSAIPQSSPLCPTPVIPAASPSTVTRPTSTHSTRLTVRPTTTTQSSPRHSGAGEERRAQGVGKRQGPGAGPTTDPLAIPNKWGENISGAAGEAPLPWLAHRRREAYAHRLRRDPIALHE